MKKATLLLWLIIFGFIVLLILQNQTFFLVKNDGFNLNFGIKQYSIPQIYNAILVLVFFIAGLIIAYLFSFSARFKAKRTIKKLNTMIASHMNEMDGLKNEINKLKGLEATVDGQADTVMLDMSASRKIAAETGNDNSAAETGTESSADKTMTLDADEAASNPGKETEENPEDETGEIRPK